MIYLSYAAFDKDFAEPLARALDRNGVSPARNIDRPTRIREYLRTDTTTSVVVVTEEYFESPWTSVEYEEIAQAIQEGRGVVVVIFLNVDRARAGETAARYKNGSWDPTWIDNERVWFLEGQPTPEDAARQIANRVQDGWSGLLGREGESARVRALSSEKHRLASEVRTLRAENQSLRAANLALEKRLKELSELHEADSAARARPAHDAVLSVVENRFISEHQAEVEELIRKALQSADFNDGLTIERPLWQIKFAAGRPGDRSLRHVIATCDGVLRAACLCVPVSRLPDQEETDIGWFVVDPELPGHIGRALLADVVRRGLALARDAGFKQVVTTGGTAAGAHFLEEQHGFAVIVSNTHETRWLKKL